MPSIAEQLKSVPIFEGLPSKTIHRLTRITRERDFAPGEAIVSEGSAGVGFFMITQGNVSVERGGVNLTTLKPGDYFGEMALLEEGHRRSATVTATSPVHTLAMMRSDFVAELEGNAELGIQLLSTMSKRLRATDQRIAEHER